MIVREGNFEDLNPDFGDVVFEETSLNEVSFSFLLAFAFDHHLLYFQLLTSLKSYTPFSIPQFSTVIKVFSEQNQISCF